MELGDVPGPNDDPVYESGKSGRDESMVDGSPPAANVRRRPSVG